MSLINYLGLSGCTTTFSKNDLSSIWQQNISCMDNDIFYRSMLKILAAVMLQYDAFMAFNF